MATNQTTDATRSERCAVVERFDCGPRKGAQFCQGCYTMLPEPDGDYVRYEEYRHLQNQLALVTKLARIYYGDQHPQEHAVLTRAEALSDESQNIGEQR